MTDSLIVGGAPEQAYPPAELLRLIAEQSGEMIAAMDRELRFIAFNRTYHDEFLRIFGSDIAVGTDVRAALAHLPEERTAVVDVWSRALAGEVVTQIQEYGDARLARKWFELELRPLHDPDGHALGAYLVGRDVTAREEARAEVERLAAELEHRVQERTAQLGATVQRLEDADRARARFLSVISHELRTPLTAIAGYIDLLESGVGGTLAPLQHEQVTRMHAATWHIVSIIDEILTYARTEEGRERVRLEETDVIRIARESADMVRPQAGAKQLGFRMESPRGPLPLLTDAGKLRQILVNLLGNAVKFTRDRAEAVIEVGGRAEAGENVYWVKDNGVGFDMRY
ncbi:MAG TPA: histidine kinase dimerization/phospho-acceptor domain-containing protein, partial [Longimicrobiales bacterium]